MDVVDWLRGLGLEQYVAAFRENAVTADLLPDLTPQDLKEIGVTAVGHRRRLLRSIAALRVDCDANTGVAQKRLIDDTQLPGSAAERRQLSVMFCDLVCQCRLNFPQKCRSKVPHPLCRKTTISNYRCRPLPLHRQ
jgi:SAM domain (Sterile alpha motif)